MTPTTLPYEISTPLREQWLRNPDRFAGKRQIETAEALGVSEGEWVDACVGHESTPLVNDPKAFLRGLPALGEVMALTRNPSAVHEKNGYYDHINFFDKMGMAQVVNHDIDLRIFLRHWHALYAVTVEKNGAPQHSLQVFDAAGRAVHKIFMRSGTDVGAWHAFVESRRDPDPAPLRTEPATAPGTRAAGEVDAEAFRADWDGMKDTHEFFPLLKRHGLARIDALRLAGGERARGVEISNLAFMLKNAARRKVPIMVFVGNRGCIQIHTGPVENVLRFKHWLNVMDPGFNLHLREDRVAEAWVVRKPTRDGTVTSLELYDADGNEIALMFGERKPGQWELEAWRELISELENASPSNETSKRTPS